LLNLPDSHDYRAGTQNNSGHGLESHNFDLKQRRLSDSNTDRDQTAQQRNQRDPVAVLPPRFSGSALSQFALAVVGSSPNHENKINEILCSDDSQWSIDIPAVQMPLTIRRDNQIGWLHGGSNPAAFASHASNSTPIFVRERLLQPMAWQAGRENYPGNAGT
jgi:hypothetical protein